MLREGFFITPEKQYDLYEIETQGFYRFDILENNATFHIDFNRTVYSQVQRKNTAFYGDSALYEKYLDLKQRALSSRLITTKSSKWDDGKFVTATHSESKSKDIIVDCILHNNIKMQETISIDGHTIHLYESARDYEVKLDPINFTEYSSSKVSKDTILTDDPNAPYHSVETLRRRYPLDHIYDNDFVVVDGIVSGIARLNEWKNSTSPYKGFDTETTGLDVDIYGTDKMVGIILGETKTKSTYFPFRMDNMTNLPMSFLAELMKVVIEQQDRLTAHNKKFDRKVMLKEGYDLRIKYCTYQISMILDPMVGVDHPHDLKTLIYNKDKKKYVELSEIFINQKDINFAILPIELVHLYGCADGSNAIILLEDQLDKLPRNQMKLVELECALSDVKADQEYYGIRVDVELYEKEYNNCIHIRNTLLDKFRILTREDGNINSSGVLQNLIYNKMKCDILLRTQTGAPSVSGKAIEKLASRKTKKAREVVEDIVDLNGKVIVSGKALSEAMYPALLILNEYKTYNKLITAFYARFERTMKTGRIFFWINQNGAASGRQSSPMHQLPAALKRVILSDADDRDFWGPDYAQIELRMIGYLAGEKELVELCADPDNDIHRVIHKLISNQEMWTITSEQRNGGKRRNFGVVYKIGAFGLAQQIFGPGPTSEQVEFCQNQLDDFYKKFKRIKRFIDNNGKIVQEKGYMETKWLHRRRMFPEIFDPDIEPRKFSSILRMANNMPVQGTAADYLKLAEVYMYEYIRAKGWNKCDETGFPLVRMMLSIHDEVILSTHNEIVYEEVVKMIRDCMEIPIEGAPPFFVEPCKMDNWGDHASEGLKLTVKLRDKLISDYEQTGISVINRETYAKVVTAYESNIVHEYMTDLVAKYGTDYKLVGEHVRHPVFTHKLLAIYEKRIPYNMEHVDRITEAARLYIEEELLGNKNSDVSIVFNMKLEDDDDDKKIQTEMKVQFGEIEDLVNYDADGNVIYETEEQSDMSDNWYDDSPDYEEIVAEAKNPIMYVYELADSIVFDLNDCTQTGCNEVLRYIASISVKDGFFRCQVVYNDKLLDTKLCVENINMEEANAFVISRMEVIV